MNGLNVEALAMVAIGFIVSTTKDQVDSGVDHLAAEIVKVAKSTDTAVDDTVIRDLLAPAVARLAAKIAEGLA